MLPAALVARLMQHLVTGVVGMTVNVVGFDLAGKRYRAGRNLPSGVFIGECDPTGES
jgi:hypothetical protein